jgi:DNA-binding transcriptional regulator YiaG
MSREVLTPAQIKAYRKKCTVTQAGLAERLGVSRRTVEEWEAGRNPPPLMLTFALQGLADPMPPSEWATWIGEA